MTVPDMRLGPQLNLFRDLLDFTRPLLEDIDRAAAAEGVELGSFATVREHLAKADEAFTSILAATAVQHAESFVAALERRSE